MEQNCSKRVWRVGRGARGSLGSHLVCWMGAIIYIEIAIIIILIWQCQTCTGFQVQTSNEDNKMTKLSVDSLAQEDE